MYASVREAAVSLLRGDQCHVIVLDDPSSGMPGASSSSSSADGIDRLSHSLVLRAIEAGGPVLLADSPFVDSADSIVLSGLRSALCAPIFCDGQAVACLYVTHSNVEGLFGPDEIQMTEFVTALAGAVLEHVAGTEARFRSLAQNSSDVITIVNRDFRITYQSSAVTRVFGFEPSEIVGRPLTDWLHPDDVAAFHALLRSVLAGGQDTRLVECRLRHHDGSWRDVETAVNNLVDDPSVNGVVMNTRDISDRKRAERELRETLGREQEMRESLQELDRIKTDFVSSVSHELRTPLSSILGYVEMLADGSCGSLVDEQTRLLGVVDRNARRLQVLIEDLLIMSRVESGTFRLSVGPVSIADVIEGAQQAVLPDLLVRDLDVTIDVSPDLDPIQGDAGQLDRVIINLLTNAIKFTPDGGRIAISALRQGDTVVIRVVDTGMGIPEDEQERVFERFFRSSSAQRLAVPGTGLGLSITRSIIEKHGGTITVSSHPGEGTAFTVTLPAHSDLS